MGRQRGKRLWWEMEPRANIQSKPEAAPAAPPPPPRAQTASPSQVARPDVGTRAMSAAPAAPPLGGNAPPGPPSRSGTAGFSEMPDGQIRRNKSSLSESTIASQAGLTPMSSASAPPGRPPTAGAGAGAPPKPASRPGSASIDDLLSRPPSKRPGSSAKKPMRNRYVDVFQPTEGS